MSFSKCSRQRIEDASFSFCRAIKDTFRQDVWTFGFNFWWLKIHSFELFNLWSFGHLEKRLSLLQQNDKTNRKDEVCGCSYAWNDYATAWQAATTRWSAPLALQSRCLIWSTREAPGPFTAAREQATVSKVMLLQSATTRNLIERRLGELTNDSQRTHTPAALLSIKRQVFCVRGRLKIVKHKAWLSWVNHDWRA